MVKAGVRGPRRRRAVVFDLDDTLLPEWQYVRSGYRAVAVRLGRSSAEAEEIFGWLWQRFEQGRHRDSFDVLAGRCGGLSVPELVTLYRQHTPQLRLSPGVRALLRELREAGVALGLISDGLLDSQTRKLQALELEPLLDQVILTDQWGRQAWKPHPRAFLELEERFGLRGAALAYVGDNLSKDFVSPARLGWHRVCLRRPRQVHARLPAPAGAEALVTVRSWRALRAHLQAWLQAVPGAGG